MCLMSAKPGRCKMRDFRRCLDDGEKHSRSLNNTRICKTSLRQNASALEYVQDRYKTQVTCEKTIIVNPWSLEHVPDILRTERCVKEL